MNPYLTILLALFLILSGCSQSDKPSAAEESQTEVASASTAEATAAPGVDISSIELIDLAGNPISWESLRGKKVFLNFWATWCKPCIIEMPSMHEAAQQLGDDFVFLAASYEEMKKIQAFADQRDFNFQFVHTKTPLEMLNIYSIPTTFLINGEGELVETVIGSRPWDTAETIDQLKNL